MKPEKKAHDQNEKCKNNLKGSLTEVFDNLNLHMYIWLPYVKSVKPSHFPEIVFLVWDSIEKNCFQKKL